ncbi:MAG: DUF2156 domain-containing protein [Planctomyces sp.]|nr:DUF2156 domain-containing protein [Planctomyces sp.]
MPQTQWKVPPGCTHASHRDELDHLRHALAEQLAFLHGESYDSYLLLEPGRQYFFSSDDQGVVGFSTWRNHLYVVGGLLTAPHQKAQLLREFLEFAQLNHKDVSFLNLLASDLPVFRSQQFEVSKIGEEPVVDLRTATWRGREFEWVRRQENFCLRNGVSMEEVEPDFDCRWYREELVPQLEEVSRQHLADTVYGRELSLVVSRLQLDNMLRRRLFVARGPAGIEAFVVATPACDGQLWAVETYRRRPTATRGVIAFLILQIARQLQSEGTPFLSLCQVPALRVNRGTASDSRFVRNGMSFWWNCLPWFYDVPRQYHFKSRFRPSYRECFIASYPRTACLPLLAFFFKWGIIWPDFKRLPMQMLRRMRKWRHAERLADPNQEQFELIERLPVAGGCGLIEPVAAPAFVPAEPIAVARPAVASAR